MNKDNRKLNLLIIGWAFMLGVSMALYEAGSLFHILHYSSDMGLAKGLVYGGIGVVTFAAFYTRYQVRWPFIWVAVVLQLALAGYTLFLLLYDFEGNNTAYSILLFAGLPSFIILTNLMFNGVTTRLFDIHDQKRKAAKLANSIIIGKIIILGLAAVTGWFDIFTDTQFIWFSLLFSVIALGLLVSLAKGQPVLSALQDSVQYLGFENPIRKVFRQRYLLLLGAFAFLTTLLWQFVNFSFLYITDERYTDLKELSFFLAIYLLAAEGTTLLIKTLFRAKILNQYGMRTTLLIPAVITILFSCITYFFGQEFGFSPTQDAFFLFFIVWNVQRVLYDASHNALQSPTFSLYFLPIRAILRTDTYAKAGVFTQTLGVLFAGLVLHWFTKNFTFNSLQFSIINSVVAIMLVVVIVMMHRQYRHVLKNTLDKQQLTMDNLKAAPSFIQKVLGKLPEVKAGILNRHLNLLYSLNPVTARKAVLDLLSHEDDQVQEIVLKMAGRLCLLDAIKELEEIQRSKYFQVSPNAELIRSTYSKLKGAAFRLEKIRYIEQLTMSKQVKERVFGALLTTYAEEELKARLLNKLFRDRNVRVRKQAVAASAGSKEAVLHRNLIEKLGDTTYANAAVASLVASGQDVLPVLESAFYTSGQEESVQLRIVEVYGKIGGEQAVDYLLKKLEYTNQNIVQAALNALSRSGYTVSKEKLLEIKRELDEVCGVLIWNMSVYLDLERENAGSLLMQAMDTEIKGNYDKVFQLLALIYEPRSVQLVRDNISSGDVEKAEFASELLDLFIAEEAKAILLPILNVSSYKEKIIRLQYQFPTESMSRHEALRDLIQRDYKWVNRWTKVCAMKELENDFEQVDVRLYQANLVNPHPMLRETAALILYRHNAVEFQAYIERFSNKLSYFKADEILAKVVRADSEEGRRIPELKWEIVEIFSNTEDFKDTSGLVLSELASKLTIEKYKKEDYIIFKESPERTALYYVHEGSVSVTDERSGKKF
ncbi:MAG: HEAT repeat domain-containing protein, partial [Cyclobacteriaceae bacterium]